MSLDIEIVRIVGEDVHQLLSKKASHKIINKCMDAAVEVAREQCTVDDAIVAINELRPEE